MFFGGAVENRTPVRNLATPNFYMLRKVVLSYLAFTQPAKLRKTSL